MDNHSQYQYMIRQILTEQAHPYAQSNDVETRFQETASRNVNREHQR